MRKIPFESFTLGHLLVMMTILYGIIVYLLDQRLSRVQEEMRLGDKVATEQREDMKDKVNNLDWYRQQGVDFSYARKFNIKPRQKEE